MMIHTKFCADMAKRLKDIAIYDKIQNVSPMVRPNMAKSMNFATLTLTDLNLINIKPNRFD